MLKKLYSSFVIVLFTLFISACSESSSPQLGKQYAELPNDLTALELSPITEVFSLTCGHCLNMESSLPEIEELTGHKVGKVHVTFNESSQVSAMLFYAALMQLEDEHDSQLTHDLFAVVQQNEGTMEEKQARIENVFTSRNLISPYRFDQGHISALEKYMEFANTVTQKAEINSVPSFIIKGKYLLITEGHDDIKDLSNTINFLLSKSE